MDDILKKSVQLLELERVLKKLSDNAVSDRAKEEALAISPMTDIGEVEAAQKRTTDAKKLIGLRGAPGFSGIKDVSAALRRADAGGVLNPRELLDIAALLRAARTVRGYIGDDSRISTCLDEIFASLSVNKYLEDLIFGAILSEEEIADNASPALSEIRRKIAHGNSKIRETMQKIITSKSYSRYLQDAIITQRSGRYVVPVKSEYRAEINGLVHDISDSGATLFIEPMTVVQLNNELRELAAKEQKEIERILASLSAEVSGFTDAIYRNFNLLVRLDLIFAAAKLSYALNAEEPSLNTRGEVYLKNARHPLLDPKTTVPITVGLGVEYDTLIITGPNTGGKTVALKTIGLLTLMAECGLHIPADSGSRISVFGRVFADIGDEQSIEQSLSTFSSHMTNIVSIINHADDKTLILLDELGAGTDPVEGAALAVSIIEYARALGARVAATTHYTELKSYALTTDGVENASCEFDVKSLKPTYRLLVGIPGRSNAFLISRRLGLPDYIIDSARERVASEDVSFEEIITQLDKKRRILENELEKAERIKREAEERLNSARRLEEQLNSKKDNATEIAKAEAARIIKDARAAAEEAFIKLDELKKMEKARENTQMINTARAELKRGLNIAEKNLFAEDKPKTHMPPPRELRAGDTVEIVSLGTKGTVIKPADSSGNVEVQAGILKINVKLNDIILLEEQGAALGGFISKKQAELRKIAISPELDLRGMMSEDAEHALEMYLDNAFMAKLGNVTLIHGKGTGALRKAVHGFLKKHPHVKSFRLGNFGEGDTGVTIVELK
ncbi:MAG: endonuclease MutS2 [Clostridiales bacterium]|nr:endonuclease MutS2 [Clostridiales bacterium]